MPTKGDISIINELRSDPNNLIIDLRWASLYNCAHIAGTVNVPADELLWRIGALAHGLGAPIYLFCMAGMKSAPACEELEEAGYTTVCDLGSISGWKGGYETPFGFQPNNED
ncbi:MAG: rhodanese-like domain-containing protein [Eubacteriaceae bacterium]|nr:rhodanese-like domain-containing protein [Eubacteriaceae bacterium]